MPAVALKIDNAVNTSEISKVMDGMANKPNLVTLIAVAESSARESYLLSLNDASKIGERVGKAKARKALIAGIPSDTAAFHEWASK